MLSDKKNADTARSLADAPVAGADRIEAIDVLRGFALLGILLLNILGMGMHSSSYTTPGADIAGGSLLDLGVWVIVDIGFEGAMRALFSLLFGAGVVLFATGSKARAAGLFYRRHCWLLVFGLINGFVLLWSGDILVTYAVVGFFLYALRNVSAKNLLVMATLLLVLLSLSNTALQIALSDAKSAATRVEQLGSAADTELLDAAAVWTDFKLEMGGAIGAEEELRQRRESYAAAFTWNIGQNLGFLLFALPAFAVWDALLMMLIGMALFKLNVLDGSRSRRFYLGLTLLGFSLGLVVNGYEVYRALTANFALLDSLLFFQWSYHIGRMAMAFGWLGLLMLMCKSEVLVDFRRRLAATGRMALSNYLMHSLIALFLFTGAGFALVGELNRWMLYPIVFAIWCLQMILSPWWLARYRFGPCEWLWRVLTYWRLPAMKKI